MIRSLLALAIAAPLTIDLPTLVLPEGVGSWVVRIVTTGGFTGRGTGDVTASSTGELFCVAVASCPGALVPDVRGALAPLVAAIPLGAVVEPAARGTCNDCVTTTLTVRRRDAGGERTATYAWDPTTATRVPDEVRQLHRALLAIVSPRRSP